MFCCTYSDCGQQTFRYISHNDTNQEDDSLEPGVTQRERQDEEADTKEYSHGWDDMNEMLNLNGDGGISDGQTRGEIGNTSHDSSVTSLNDDAMTGTWR